MTSQVPSTPNTPAPWRESFLSHIGTMPAPRFTLATVTSDNTPRARTCIFRGLWGELPPNKHNDAPRNPDAFQSDLPVFTTDARMAKAGELAGRRDVEAVWWAEAPQTQWRVRGQSYVLRREPTEDARQALLPHMRSIGASTGEWSWEREVTAHFGNMSPASRGAFRNPPSGTPLAEKPGEGEALGQKVEALDDELARRHFCVVVIVPSEVDQVDLSNPERHRRWLYTYRGKSYMTTHTGGEIIGEWEKVETWP